MCGIGDCGIVGAQGDNIVSNFTIRREGFARTTSTGSSRTATTGSRRGSTGRNPATTSPLRRTTRTVGSITSRRTTTKPEGRVQVLTSPYL